MKCEFCDEPAIYMHLLMSYAKPEYYCWKHGDGCPGCKPIERKENEQDRTETN